MSDMEEDEVLGTIRTPRHEVVRYRIGHDSGDVFDRGGDYDGPTLVLEVSGVSDAKAMLDAIGAHTQATTDDLIALNEGIMAAEIGGAQKVQMDTADARMLMDAARCGAARIEALELEKDVERQRAEARQGECEAKAQIIADLEHQLAEAEVDAERLAAQVEALWPKSAGACPALAAHRARKETT